MKSEWIKLRMIKNKQLQIVIHVIMISFLLFQTGCNYREITDLPMITGMSIDKVDETYLLTAQVLIPKIGGGGQEGGSVEQIFINTAGKSIFDAVRDFIMKNGGKRVFFGHLNYVIISDKIASEDISEVLDFLMRDDEIREDLYLLIGDSGLKAEELLVTGLNDEQLTFYIPNAMENVDVVSKFNPVTLEEMVGCINASGTHLVIPLLQIETVLNEKRVIINDGAVMNGKKKVGVMQGEGIQIMRLLKNEEKGGIYVVNYEDKGKKTKVSLEVKDSKTKINVMKTKENFLIQIDCDMQVSIGEIMNQEVKVLDSKNIDNFKKEAEEQIKQRILKTIRDTQQQFGIDVFRFSNKVKIKYPKEYKEIEDQWDIVFNSLSFEASVELDIQGSALTEQVLEEKE